MFVAAVEGVNQILFSMDPITGIMNFAHDLAGFTKTELYGFYPIDDNTAIALSTFHIAADTSFANFASHVSAAGAITPTDNARVVYSNTEHSIWRVAYQYAPSKFVICEESNAA